MLIVNADDWGRSRRESDLALTCYRERRITAVSAMVFMEDSARAADAAKEAELDVGLHLNLTEAFTANHVPARLHDVQSRIAAFLKRNKYSKVLYSFHLRDHFRIAYELQAEEFYRLYGKQPSHVDGHQHMHHCSNMLLEEIIPRGQQVRRNFSFWPGEKSSLNRAYRGATDWWLGRRYRLTDYFFSLLQCLETNRLDRITKLAQTACVELMTHPVNAEEYAFLMSDAYSEMTRSLKAVSYA